MKLHVLVLCLALTVSAHAQETWRGLHFGQSRDDVKAQLASQGFGVGTDQEGTLQSLSDYEMPLPGLRHTLPFHVEFHFNEAATLNDVAFVLDLSVMRHGWPELGPDEVMLNFASERITRALTDKYGVPLYRSAGCDVADTKQPPAACSIDWRANAQSVQLDRFPTPRGPRLVLRYQVIAAEL